MLDKENPVHVDKAGHRKSARATRDALSAPRRQSANEEIYEACCANPVIANAKTIFVYISMPEEVNTFRFIDTFLSADVTTPVPFVFDEQTMIATRFPGWQSLRTGMLNILTPLLGTTP